MGQTLQQRIKEACEDIGSVTFRDYSGRGMMGRQCIAITGTRTDCNKVIKDVAEQLLQATFDNAIDADGDDERQQAYDDHDSLCRDMRTLMDTSIDQMGYDIVLYWPSVKPEEVVEED